jgi:hypothetical protein
MWPQTKEASNYLKLGKARKEPLRASRESTALLVPQLRFLASSTVRENFPDVWSYVVCGNLLQ